VKKKIISIILAAVMLFPTTSITALASNNVLEEQGSNTLISNITNEVEAGNFIIEDNSSIIEESVNEVTVENNNNPTSTINNTDEIQTQQEEIQQPETEQENTSQNGVNADVNIETNQSADTGSTVTESKVTEEAEASVDKEESIPGPDAVNNLKYKRLNYKQVKLTWKASEGATRYKIYRSTREDGKYKRIKTTRLTTYTSKVSCGRIYFYKVIPYADTKKGEESIIKVFTRPNKASNLKADVDGTTVKLTWSKGNGATSYYIYRSTKKKSDFQKIAETKKLNYSDKKLKQGESYYYRIYSVSKGIKGWRVSSKKCRISTGPKAVKALKYKRINYKTIKITWKASKGATRYKIYRATSKDGRYKRIKTTKSTSYTKRVPCGKIYYYKIIPYKGSLRGKEKIIKAYSRPDKVKNLKTSVTGTTIELTFNKAKGARSYYIYRSTNKNSSFTRIAETKENKYYDNNLISGETYYYKVYAVSRGTKGKKVTSSVNIPKQESSNNTNEIRAAWISYLDYATLKDKSQSEFTKSINAMYDTVLEKNVNTVIVHVRAFSDAVYPSSYYRWANFITSDSDGPSYDPLKIMIEQAHKKGLSFEAWINPYRTADGGRVNPGSSSAVKKIVAGVEEIVTNYDVDGIHFDDYFYLSTDTTSQAEKMKHVNTMVSQVYAKIKSINSNVIFGISPAGNIEYAQSIGCDVDTWLSKAGYIDYICPQLYWSDDYVTKSGVSTKMFTNTMKQWTSKNKNNTAMYAGLALYKVGNSVESAWGSDYGWGNSTSNLYHQYKAAKNAGYAGYSLYRYGSFGLPAAKEELNNLKKLSE
jgi:uncharacterized lipoprotein YddW (UPF0748 family)